MSVFVIHPLWKVSQFSEIWAFPCSVETIWWWKVAVGGDGGHQPYSDIGVQLQQGSSDVGCQGHVIADSTLLEHKNTKNSSHFSQNSSLNTIICNYTRQGSVAKWNLTLIPFMNWHLHQQEILKSLVSVLWKRSKVSLMSQKSLKYEEWTTATLLSGDVLTDWLIGKKYVRHMVVKVAVRLYKRMKHE